jgi:hypothetical protein
LATDYARVLHWSLPELDGFGVASPIYFFLDGALDPQTLPHSAAESDADGAGVFLIDADTASPDAFKRVRVEVQWSAEHSRLALRPALGLQLTPGRRYAALVTRRVKDLQGRPLEPAPKFAAVRDAGTSLVDPELLRARANYAPVLETLAKNMPREDVVAMAVFRVQTVAQDLEDVRRLVRSREALVAGNVEILEGAELDQRFGDPKTQSTAAAHDNLRAVIHGTLSSPNLLSKTAKTHGAWVRNDDGELEQKGTPEEVPFSLFVPKGVAGTEVAQVVMYQHALHRDRSDAVYIANALARQNIAVFAIDAPFQGMRARSGEGGSVDSRNRFTGVKDQDRFGDEPGDFYGEDDLAGLLLRFHPFYIRDALRQGVVDLMTAVRFLESDELGKLVSRSGASVRLDTRRLGFVGEDIGATMGSMLAPFESKVQALCLVGASAFVAQGFWLAASEQPRFEMLSNLLGRSLVELSYDTDSPAFWPEMALFETLLGRGEPVAYASQLRRAPANVLLMMARDDEVVANLGTEALAVALGASFLNNDARYAGDLTRKDAASGERVSGNFQIEAGRVTRLLRVYEDADHRLLRADTGKSEYRAPVRPPFVSRDAPVQFDNPRALALQELGEYFRSFFACVKDVNVSATTVACSADIVAP